MDRALLIVGYGLAVPAALSVRRTLRERDALRFFGGLETGTVLVALGWARRGARVRAGVNLVACAALPLLWVRSGRRFATGR